jgi:hypothetical protein
LGGGNRRRQIPYNNDMKALIVILVIVILALGVGFTFWFLTSSPQSPAPVACSLIAKLCPDGSYVARTGPKCEFAACPPQNVTSGLSGTVLLGPTCPVQRIPPDPQCADRPYATTLVLTSADQSRVITTFSSTASGTFSIPVAPGDYVIRSAAATNIHPYCATTNTIHVSSGTFAKVTVQCDTGIR